MSVAYVKKGVGDGDKGNITYFNDKIIWNKSTRNLKFWQKSCDFTTSFCLEMNYNERLMMHETHLNQRKICNKSHMTRIKITPKLQRKSSDRQTNLMRKATFKQKGEQIIDFIKL